MPRTRLVRRRRRRGLVRDRPGRRRRWRWRRWRRRRRRGSRRSERRGRWGSGRRRRLRGRTAGGRRAGADRRRAPPTGGGGRRASRGGDARRDGWGSNAGGAERPRALGVVMLRHREGRSVDDRRPAPVGGRKRLGRRDPSDRHHRRQRDGSRQRDPRDCCCGKDCEAPAQALPLFCRSTDQWYPASPTVDLNRGS
jgi:hypothetical protein